MFNLCLKSNETNFMRPLAFASIANLCITDANMEDSSWNWTVCSHVLPISLIIIWFCRDDFIFPLKLHIQEMICFRLSFFLALEYECINWKCCWNMQSPDYLNGNHFSIRLRFWVFYDLYWPNLWTGSNENFWSLKIADTQTKNPQNSPWFWNNIFQFQEHKRPE